MSQIDEIHQHFEGLSMQTHLTERQMVGVLVDHIAALEDALRYIIEVREIKCLHRASDGVGCALCHARALLNSEDQDEM